MSSFLLNGRISTRSSEPYADLPATIITDVPEGYDNGIILPAAYKGPNQPFYLTADPANLNVSNTLAVGGEINLNGGILTVADGLLELDGVPVGGGGGGAVNSVVAGNGLTVSPTTGNVVVAMPDVGSAGTVNNVANIVTDAQGRVTSKTSYGYVPQSAADVAAAVAPYAPLAGATFTGPVNTSATTLTVATPTVDTQAATKLYVDNAVAGITPGGAVNTVVAGSNIAVNSTNPANPVVAVAISSALNMNSNEINNVTRITAVAEGELNIDGSEVNITQSSATSVMNLTASGAMALAATGAIGIAGGGTVQITSLGNITIGSGNVLGADTEIEHVAFKDNVISKYTTIAPGPNPDLIIQDVDTISMSGDLTTTANVNAANILASGSVQAPQHNIGVTGAYTDIKRASDGTLTTQLNGAGSLGGIVDTLINPAQLSLSGTTLNVTAKNAAGVQTTMGSVDIAPAVPGGLKNYITVNVAGGSTYNVTAAQANSAIWFDVTSGGNVIVTLPNAVPDGTQFFIGLPYDTAVGSQLTVYPVGGGLGQGRETVIKTANGGCLFVANGVIAGNVMYMPTDTGAYLALTGGTLTGALQVEPTTNIEAKNITTALLTPLPDVGYISALGPMQVEGGNFLVANGTSTEIGLAATANPAPGEVATIQYNFAADDLLHFNKVLEAPGAVLDGNDVVPLLTFKDAQTFYVSKQGADTNTGAINAPFLTVQAAINAALATGSEAVVDVAVGTYTENLTIASVAGILIRGCSQSDRLIEGTILKGVININVTGVDNLNNNQIMITGCTVLGHIHDTSSKQHTLIIDGCRIEGDTANAGQAVLVAMTATDGRTVIQNCVITQEAGTTGINAVVSANVGWLNVYECDITARAEGCCIDVHGSCWLQRLSQCSLASSSSSGTPNALLFLNSTTATPHAISLTTFAYNVATSKTSPAILATRPSAGAIYATVASCVFALAGTLAAGNVIQYGVGTALVLFVAANRSLNTAAAAYASQIQSGATVLPLTLVGETAVTSVNNANGAVNVVAGTNITVGTSGNTITITGTKNGTLTGVGAGAGIAVDNTNPAVPVVSNTGVTRLIAGTNISLTAETGEITISASGGGGGGGNVDSVSAGTGILLTGTAQDVIVNNAGVLSVSVNSTLENTGTATEPILGINATGTVSFEDLSVNKIDATGGDASTFSKYPRINGAYVPPANDNDLVPKQYVDGQSYGVQSVTAADASIEVGGTPTNPTIAVAASGVVGGSYTNTSLTVGADGRITAAASGTPPVLSVVAGTGIAVDNTVPSAPVVSNTGIVSATAGAGISIAASTPGSLNIANTGVLGLTAADASITVAGTASNPTVALPNKTLTPTSYTWPAVTVDQKGIITAIAENTVPFTELNAGNGIDISGTPGSATIAVEDSGVVAGSYTYTDITVGADGRITAAASGAAPVLSVSGTALQIASTGGANPTLSLVDTAVVPGSFTYMSGTVDAKGRLTAAASGVAPVVSVSGTATQIASTGGSAPVLSLVDTAVTPGSYTYASLTVDAKGRLTAASSGTAPTTTTVNGNSGTVVLAAGTNMTLDETVPGTITFNASGGGGGIASINSATGPAITIAAGSGISVGTVSNTITITNTGGGGGGVQSVSAVPGGGILIDNTDPANPILNNGGVVSLNAFQAASGNIELDNTDGFIGISNIPDPIPGSVQKIRLGYNGLNSISATDGSITLTGTAQSRSIKANPGGAAYADIDMAAAYKITKATGINTTDKLSFAEIDGFQNGYAMKGTDAGSEPGITRVEVDSANAEVANTTAVMYDERNYAPTSPFNPASGFTPGPGGLFVSGTAKLIASQTTTLTQANWPCKYASKYLGVSGSISFVLSAAQPLSYLVRYRKNGGTLTNASGGVYYTSTQSVSVPVSGITWNGVGGNTFTVGDTFTWELYATYTGVSPPSIATAPTVFSAVFSPLAV